MIRTRLCNTALPVQTTLLISKSVSNGTIASSKPCSDQLICLKFKVTTTYSCSRSYKIYKITLYRTFVKVEKVRLHNKTTV